MDHHFERYDRIRQMREAGESFDDIFSALEISWQMGEVVRRMVRKFETEAVLSARSSRFLEEIRNADDLDKKWKVSFAVQALRPKIITQNSIIRYFKPEVSLRELMDLTISPENHSKPGFLITPILDLRCVGVEGFWSMVSRFTQSDLGERCNEEWRKRLERLKVASRIVGGGQYSWSKPAEPPSWVFNLQPTKTENLHRH